MGQKITQWFSPQALLCCGSRNRGLTQVGTHSLPWSPAVQETHLNEQDLMFCVLLILASGDQSDPSANQKRQTFRNKNTV